MGTVGAVARDRRGNLAAATSTGGLTAKRPGRIGDTPIIGAGTYANNASCAVSATGVGEQFIRHSVAHQISALLLLHGLDLDEAASQVIDEELEPDDGGLIAVSREGALSLVFNTEGMLRGAADSSGRFAVAVWRDGE
jgi:beta-aspartyl-peptidase (threonine type)